MIQGTNLTASFTLPGTSLTVNRMGYGAMQLAGPHVFGPPRDSDEAIAVLREAVDSGVNHIRHQRLLRSARYQSDHSASTSSLSERFGDRYQAGRATGCRRLLDSCSLPAGVD
jgi:hypothetical protein